MARVADGASLLRRFDSCVMFLIYFIAKLKIFFVKKEEKLNIYAFVSHLFSMLKIQIVSHEFLFRFQIVVVIFVGRYLDRDVFHNFEAVCLQPYTLCRVVGHQSHLVHTEVA